MGWIPSWFDWLQHKKVGPPFAWISNKSHWVWSHSHLSLGLPSFFRSIGLIYVALVIMGLFCGMSVVPAIPDMLQSAKWESVSFIFFGIVLLSDHKQAFSCILSIMGSYVAVNKNLVWPLENVTVKQVWHSWDISIYFYEVTNLGYPPIKDSPELKIVVKVWSWPRKVGRTEARWSVVESSSTMLAIHGLARGVIFPWFGVDIFIQSED